jgi:hypothetical protein
MSRAAVGARVAARRAVARLVAASCAVVSCALALCSVVPGVARAQSVVVTAPPGDTLRSATPTFFVQASDFTGGRPLRIRFEIATSPLFTPSSIVLDTALLADSSVTVAPATVLPQSIQIYWRARATAPDGVMGMSPVGGPRVTPNYLTLVSPAFGNGVTLTTRRPQFVWRSAPVNEPPGPWLYQLQIFNLGREVVSTVPLRDTTFVPSTDLEANASYRWRVTATLPGTLTQTSAEFPTTFVIIDTSIAVVQSLLYQNFPNPFPTPSFVSTCIWFDVGENTDVALDIYDLRGKHVRRLRPGPDGVSEMAIGRYGRGPRSDTECDPDYRWDGSDDDGRVVAPGVYLVRLRVGRYTSMKKILFRGR